MSSDDEHAEAAPGAGAPRAEGEPPRVGEAPAQGEAPPAGEPRAEGEAPPAGEPPADGEASRRLHPAGIAVLAVGALRDAALPLGVALLVAVLGGGLDVRALAQALALGLAAAAVAGVVGVVTWSTTRWRIGAMTLQHRRGLLSVKETDIPLARIQAVDTVRGPIHRLFGVVGVHVQTAGGGRDGEIVLPALATSDVEALRDAVGRRPAAAADGEPAAGSQRRLGPRALLLAAGDAESASAGPERRLGGRSLFVAALTAGQLGVLVPVLAALPQVVDDLFNGDLGDAGRAGAGLAPDTTLEWVLVAAAVVLVGWLLSMAGTVVAFAGFTVTREPDRLRIRRGLLARRDASVPVARIQAVRVVESVLRRPWRLAQLRVEVAGYKAEAAAAQTLFPLVRRSEVRAFLDELLPELADEPDGLVPVPRRAARRYALPPALAGLALGAAVAVGVPGAGPWPLLAAAAGGALGWLRWRAAGWRLEDGRLAVRSRRLACTTVLAPAGRLQQHGISQTPLQRRGDLADLEVRIGAGTRGRVRHLEAASAAALFDALRGFR